MKAEYPVDDSQFEEQEIVSVSKAEERGWSIEREDGWSYFVPGSSPIVPQPGMHARFYGAGIGYPVRGLFIDGQQIFYRTESEDKVHRDVELYGKDAADWLSRWDAGQTVWSIEMGGLGPGYEQCIQILVAEFLRSLLQKPYDATAWEDSSVWKKDREEIEAAMYANPVVKSLGPSGAQWGAAFSLATLLYRRGPVDVMNDEQVKNRHIQICRVFPGA